MFQEEVEEKTPPSLPPKKREVSERDLQQQMTSEAALSALSIGLNVERVKMAIREKLEQTGRGYSQADALVEAALNMQHDEEDMSEDGGVSGSTTTVVMSAGHAKTVKNIFDDVKNGLNDTKNTVNRRGGVDNGGNAEVDKAKLKGVSLEEENRLLKEARLCKICMDAEVGIVFLPCGHLATCVNCAPNLEDCPVCRSAIKATVRTFLS